LPRTPGASCPFGPRAPTPPPPPPPTTTTTTTPAALHFVVVEVTISQGLKITRRSSAEEKRPRRIDSSLALVVFGHFFGLIDDP